MADNTAQNGTNTIATDDVGGVHFQKFKINLGGDGVDGGAVSTTNPLPIEVTNSFATYVAAVVPFTPPATPTDMFLIQGSATKTVQINRIEITGSQTTAGSNIFYLIRRSTANTLGTAVASTKIAMDTNDAAATAVVQHYTANPTALGTSAGNVAVRRVYTPAPATALSNNGLITTFDWETGQAGKNIILRGTSQFLVVNFNGAALPAGLSIGFNVEWCEY